MSTAITFIIRCPWFVNLLRLFYLLLCRSQHEKLPFGLHVAVARTTIASPLRFLNSSKKWAWFNHRQQFCGIHDASEVVNHIPDWSSWFTVQGSRLEALNQFFLQLLNREPGTLNHAEKCPQRMTRPLLRLTCAQIPLRCVPRVSDERYS